MKLRYLVVFMLFLSFSVQAQYEKAEKSKKELRKEKREIERKAAELKVQEASVALNDRDFTLRADVLFNRRNELFQVVNTTNFVMIEDDKIFVQYGDPLNVGLNGSGGVTIEGNITKYEIGEYEEGKPLEARVFFSSPNTTRALSVFIQVTGEVAEARILVGTNRMKMRGQFERTSQTGAIVTRNYRNGM